MTTQSKRQSAIRQEHDEWAPVDYVNAAKGDPLVAEMAERWAKEIARRALAEAAVRRVERVHGQDPEKTG